MHIECIIPFVPRFKISQQEVWDLVNNSILCLYNYYRKASSFGDEHYFSKCKWFMLQYTLHVLLCVC